MSGRLQLSDLPRKYQEQAALQLGGISLQDGPEKKSAVAKFAVLNDPLEPSQIAPKHPGRYVVRIVSYRRKLLDRINLYGGCKWFEDCLQYAGIISEDREAVCEFAASQVLVKLKSDERTEITVTSPGWPEEAKSPPVSEA